MDKIRVVVADDSPFVCHLLSMYLQASPDIQVVGTALNGNRAVQLVQELRPDVVTLDLEMPQMNGLESLEYIMQECPTPVIMISGTSRRAASLTLLALNLGAIDFILKYTPGSDTNPEKLKREIIAKVRAASQTRVIRLMRTSKPQPEGKLIHMPPPQARVARVEEETTKFRESFPLLPGGVVVIGASTGGPVALRRLLSSLPEEFSAGILVIQHMPGTFTSVLAEQLSRQVPLTVREAKNLDKIEPGLVLIAPGGRHLLVRPDSRVELNNGPEIAGHRPSIDVAMQSAAQIYGSRTKGVVLTGMGEDGALGLVAIRAKGGRTYAQDADSSVINGMPQRAIDRGAVDFIGSPEEIAVELTIGQVLSGRAQVC